MSIVTEINRIKQNIANAYTELQSKSATMPATQNSANLANTISTISSSAVSNLTKITANIEDEKLTELISNNAIEITLPPTKTSIDGSFRGWTALTGITISNNITTILGRAFLGCTSLSSVTIASSVIEINSFAFGGCTSLTNINYQGTINQWQAITLSLSWKNSSSISTITCTDGVIEV